MTTVEKAIQEVADTFPFHQYMSRMDTSHLNIAKTVQKIPKTWFENSRFRERPL